jgi:DNA-binding NtrC family response regulator
MKEIVIRIALEEAAPQRPHTSQSHPQPQTEPGAPILAFAVGTPLQEIEREAITRTLEHFKGDKRRAARALGVNFSTLYR